ncbi:3-oxoacyl-ACP reductase FabG [Dyadobacter tibetensis]|uniref:3-oxoacyl-ACP reductase FabG n=1 Tax=Dyadobacter tibetensis TaxID=1211851 RepID=UPI000470E78B|nr:3-oxoacyl-ACP reductase FabG [Dyadobacter tibetensis]
MKCALVTGASRGIGRAIALQLSQDHQLYILVNYASNQEAAEETLRLIRAEGGDGELLPFRVQNKVEVDQALNDWKTGNPEKNIQVLVNNAGVTRDGLFMWMSEQDWDEVMDISTKGLFNVTQNAIQEMLRKRSGRIVNIASVSGMKGVAGQTNYSAAKGAIVAATKALAQEVAKRKITVNAVAPGFISSDMTSELNEAELKQMIPVNRFGRADEVAHLVSFLVSDKAAYITGEVININGGIYS